MWRREKRRGESHPARGQYHDVFGNIYRSAYEVAVLRRYSCVAHSIVLIHN